MTTTKRPSKTPATWPIWLLAAPAAVAIWGGWVELGEMCGYGQIRPLPGIADDFVINSAITLPVGVETYAALALRAALDPGTPRAAKKFAAYSAVVALILGAAGQIAYHVMHAAGHDTAPWWVTAVVACLPVMVLGAGAALAHLLVHGAHHTPDGDTPAPADNVASSIAPQRVTAPQSNLAITTPAADTSAVAQTSPARPARKKRGAGRATKTTTATGGSKAERARAVAAAHPEWTQEQVAAEVGCTARTVRRALSPGAADPAPREGAPVAPVFGLPLGPEHHPGLVFPAPLGPNQHTTETSSVAPILEVA